MLKVFGFICIVFLMAVTLYALLFLLRIFTKLSAFVLHAFFDVEQFVRRYKKHLTVFFVLYSLCALVGSLYYHFFYIESTGTVFSTVLVSCLICFVLIAITLLGIIALLAGVVLFQPFLLPIFTGLLHLKKQSHKSKNYFIQECALTASAFLLLPLLALSLVYGALMFLGTQYIGTTILTDSAASRVSMSSSGLDLEEISVIVFLVCLFLLFSHVIARMQLSGDKILEKQKQWTVLFVLKRLGINFLTLGDTKNITYTKNVQRSFFRIHHLKRMLLGLFMGLTADWYFQTYWITVVTIMYVAIYISLLEYIGAGDAPSSKKGI